MKNKYVFVFEDASQTLFGHPVNMSKCYIFDNLPDADVFFSSKGFLLSTYNTDSRFTISSSLTKIDWHGDIFLGQYV
jgi:hypothetical protein